MLNVVKDVAKKIAIILGSQLPVAGGLALWWAQTQQNPLVAFLLTAIYEIFIFPAWLFIKAFRDELQRRANETAPEAGKRVATWVIDRLVAEGQFLFSGFRRRYVHLYLSIRNWFWRTLRELARHLLSMRLKIEHLYLRGIYFHAKCARTVEPGEVQKRKGPFQGVVTGVATAVAGVFIGGKSFMAVSSRPLPVFLSGRPMIALW